MNKSALVRKGKGWKFEQTPCTSRHLRVTDWGCIGGDIDCTIFVARASFDVDNSRSRKRSNGSDTERYTSRHSDRRSGGVRCW